MAFKKRKRNERFFRAMARDTSRRFRISRRNYRQMLLQAETAFQNNMHPDTDGYTQENEMYPAKRRAPLVRRGSER